MRGRRFHPGMADARSRDAADIKRTNERAAMVRQRVDSHGGDGLADWLVSIGAEGWPRTDRVTALGIVQDNLDRAAHRAAVDVIGF